MKKTLSILALCIGLFSCSKQDTTIALNKVGGINNTTTVQDLKHLFKNDSIVSRLSEGDLGNTYSSDDDTHLIYAKGGKLLLAVAPVSPLDSVSKIKNVTIYSDAYKTNADVTIASTFNDVNIHHTIEKLEATFSYVTVFIKDINATATLKKQDIGLKAFQTGSIDKSQIPENASLNSLTVWFE